MSALDEAPTVHADDAQSWRAWLAKNHATSRGVWLVTWRARTGHSPRLAYEDAIQEALCFGWVDSTAGTVDAERAKLYFAPRRPGSVWARSNRERVERLIAQGRMTPAGLAAIERARADGSWSILMSAERLEVPEDLAAALAADPAAKAGLHLVPALHPADPAVVGRDREAAGDARVADRAHRGVRRPG